MSEFLDRISSPCDIKKLTVAELDVLAGEIREFLVESVTRTGGHLASNLGVVEITLALLAVFDMPEDKIIWDVGHQSYVYKLLTGRKENFATLRKFGGMSGFPKTEESVYDCFNTGHSSTSASAAVGMARARDLHGDKYNIIAVFGDGALTGGMMYEAMNDAGRSKNKVIYILNDNAMSIAKNVGAVSKYLRALRQKPLYFKSKEAVLGILSRLPKGGVQMARFIRRVKRIVRATILPSTMFDDLGFDYYGPVDGHNTEALINVFEHARTSDKSVFIHVLTKKGKGYRPAESDPQRFHGIAAGNPDSRARDFSAVFGDKLVELAAENKSIVAVTGAMPAGTGLLEFRAKFRDRFFDVGIAEEHAVTMSAGLAASGMIPVVPLYSSFLQRAYDQTLHDVCLQKLHVVFPIDRAGVVGADGETHQGMYDISFLYAMPDMTILSPSCYKELEQMLDYAVNIHNAPIAIRYPRGCEEPESCAPDFCFGRGYCLAQGSDAVIFTTGRMVTTARNCAALCEKAGISVQICVFPTIKPLDVQMIKEAAYGKKLAVTIEDGVIYGGFSAAVSMLMSTEKDMPRLLIKAFLDKPLPHGSIAELDKMSGMDAETIFNEIREKINER